MLTLEDVCAVSGIEPQTLRNWISYALVAPADSQGVGRGNGHRFSVAQAVGLAVAERLRKSERGCAPKYAAGIVAAFARMSEGELKKQFAKGNSHLAALHQGKPVLRPKEYDWVDVEELFDAVTARL